MNSQKNYLTKKNHIIIMKFSEMIDKEMVEAFRL